MSFLNNHPLAHVEVNSLTSSTNYNIYYNMSQLEKEIIKLQVKIEDLTTFLDPILKPTCIGKITDSEESMSKLYSPLNEVLIAKINALSELNEAIDSLKSRIDL